jgi:hypothetical protein
LNYPVVEQHRGNIDMLLGVRNAIAHGDVLKVPTERDVQNYTSSAFEVMRFVQHEIYSALRGEGTEGRQMTSHLANAHPATALIP